MQTSTDTSQGHDISYIEDKRFVLETGSAFFAERKDILKISALPQKRLHKQTKNTIISTEVRPLVSN